jgi:hypothetical protein
MMMSNDSQRVQFGGGCDDGGVVDQNALETFSMRSYSMHPMPCCRYSSIVGRYRSWMTLHLMMNNFDAPVRLSLCIQRYYHLYNGYDGNHHHCDPY